MHWNWAKKVKCLGNKTVLSWKIFCLLLLFYYKRFKAILLLWHVLVLIIPSVFDWIFPWGRPPESPLWPCFLWRLFLHFKSHPGNYLEKNFKKWVGTLFLVYKVLDKCCFLEILNVILSSGTMRFVGLLSSIAKTAEDLKSSWTCLKCALWTQSSI